MTRPLTFEELDEEWEGVFDDEDRRAMESGDAIAWVTVECRSAHAAMRLAQVGWERVER